MSAISRPAPVFQLFVPRGRRTVRLGPADRFAVSTLVLDQIAASLRGQSPDTAYQQLRACYAEPEGDRYPAAAVAAL